VFAVVPAIFILFRFLLNSFERQAVPAYRSRAPPALLPT
jgi:hypothetical protein